VALRDLHHTPPSELDLSWLDGSIGTDLSDDGSRLLISEQGTGAGTSYATYLRSTGAAPAVRLGDGLAQALSPDGSQAAVVRLEPRALIALLPTGPGEAASLPTGGVTRIDAVTFFPDGRRVLFAGSEGGRATRLYVQAVKGGAPRALSAEGVRIPYPSRPISPDGRAIAVTGADEQVLILPAEGGEPRLVQGLLPRDRPVRWSGDGKTLYVFRRNPEPARILAVDVESGAKRVLAEVAPHDRAGTKPPIAVQMTPDGRAYVYSYSETLTDLYLATGLK
jgi:dipeptidyl aminopeptidase/acylaminoacyl peptidase